MTRKTLSPRRTSPTVPPPSAPAGSKLDQLEGLLLRPAGASIAELIGATGWQPHSLRGAIAGPLRKRGLAIVSEKLDGVRRYRASRAA